MSVVLLTPKGYETIRRTIGHLREQTVRDRLEIVIVAPAAPELDLDRGELADFGGVQVVETGPMVSAAAARVAGIRRATAAIVALGEDHSFPDPDWAAALIAAHRQPWAVVGPTVANANPDTVISWANHLVEYGPWMDPASPGPVDFLPGHNSAYKRAVLLDYGPALEAMLEAECLLHQDFRSRGYQVYFEPRARTRHLNYSRPFSWMPSHFHGSRIFAAARARYGGWRAWQRLVYGGGAVLIPLVRLRRIWAGTRTVLGRGRFLRLLPALSAVLLVSAAGEMAGYVTGPGRSMAKLTRLEFHRTRYLTRRDREVLHDRPGSRRRPVASQPGSENI
jgi:GT2 family glycosyltransferase